MIKPKVQDKIRITDIKRNDFFGCVLKFGFILDSECKYLVFDEQSEE